MKFIKVERVIGSTDTYTKDEKQIESKLEVLEEIAAVFADVEMQYKEQTNDKTLKVAFNPHAPVIDFSAFTSENEIFTSDNFILESVDNLGGKIINVRLFLSE